MVKYPNKIKVQQNTVDGYGKTHSHQNMLLYKLYK